MITLKHLVINLAQLLESHGDGIIVLRDKKNELQNEYTTYELEDIGKIVRHPDTKLLVCDYYYIGIGAKMDSDNITKQ